MAMASASDDILGFLPPGTAVAARTSGEDTPYRAARVVGRTEAGASLGRGKYIGGCAVRFCGEDGGDVAIVAAERTVLLPLCEMGPWLWEVGCAERGVEPESSDALVEGFGEVGENGLGALCVVREEGVKRGVLEVGTVVWVYFGCEGERMVVWPGWVTGVRDDEFEEMMEGDEGSREVVRLFKEVCDAGYPDDEVGMPMLAPLADLLPFVPPSGQVPRIVWEKYVESWAIGKCREEVKASGGEITMPIWARKNENGFKMKPEGALIWEQFEAAVDLCLTCAEQGTLAAVDDRRGVEDRGAGEKVDENIFVEPSAKDEADSCGRAAGGAELAGFSASVIDLTASRTCSPEAPRLAEIVEQALSVDAKLPAYPRPPAESKLAKKKRKRVNDWQRTSKREKKSKKMDIPEASDGVSQEQPESSGSPSNGELLRPECCATLLRSKVVAIDGELLPISEARLVQSKDLTAPTLRMSAKALAHELAHALQRKGLSLEVLQEYAIAYWPVFYWHRPPSDRHVDSKVMRSLSRAITEITQRGVALFQINTIDKVYELRNGLDHSVDNLHYLRVGSLHSAGASGGDLKKISGASRTVSPGGGSSSRQCLPQTLQDVFEQDEPALTIYRPPSSRSLRSTGSPQSCRPTPPVSNSICSPLPSIGLNPAASNSTVLATRPGYARRRSKASVGNTGVAISDAESVSATPDGAGGVEPVGDIAVANVGVALITPKVEAAINGNPAPPIPFTASQSFVQPSFSVQPAVVRALIVLADASASLKTIYYGAPSVPEVLVLVSELRSKLGDVPRPLFVPSLWSHPDGSFRLEFSENLPTSAEVVSFTKTLRQNGVPAVDAKSPNCRKAAIAALVILPSDDAGTSHRGVFQIVCAGSPTFAEIAVLLRDLRSCVPIAPRDYGMPLSLLSDGKYRLDFELQPTSAEVLYMMAQLRSSS